MSQGINIGDKVTISKRQWELKTVDRVSITFKAYEGNAHLWMINENPKPRRCLVLKKELDFEHDDIVELKAEILHFNAVDGEHEPLTLYNWLTIKKVRKDESADEAVAAEETGRSNEDAGKRPESGSSIRTENIDQSGQTVYGDGSGEESWPSPPGGC